MKILTTSLLVFAAFLAFSMVDRIDPQVPLGLALNEAEAGPARRTSRRTARRTSRRVSTRHNYYRRPYYPVATGAAVVATALAVGTIVSSLPPSCSQVVVDGRTYQDCDGTYYVPSYDGPDVVYVVSEPPR